MGVKKWVTKSGSQLLKGVFVFPFHIMGVELRDIAVLFAPVARHLRLRLEFFSGYHTLRLLPYWDNGLACPDLPTGFTPQAFPMSG